MSTQETNPALERAAAAMEGKQHYCFRCRDWRIMTNVFLARAKNGVPTAKGTCQSCNGGMNRILPRNPA